MIDVLERLTRMEKGLLAVSTEPAPAWKAIELYGVAVYIADAMAIVKRDEAIGKAWEKTAKELRSEIDSLDGQLKKNTQFKTNVKSKKLWLVAGQGGELVDALVKRAGVFAEIGFQDIEKVIDKAF
jgi:hypothetical protein